MNGKITFQLYKKGIDSNPIGDTYHEGNQLNSFVFHRQEGLYDIFEITAPYVGNFIFQIFGSHKVYSMEPNFLTNLAIFELDVLKTVIPVQCYPIISTPYGFTESSSTGTGKIELAPAEPMVSSYKINSSQFELLFELLDPNRRYSAQLIKSDISRASDEGFSQYLAVSVENDQLRLIARSPGPGRYALVLYKGNIDSDTLTQFAAVMIEFTVEKPTHKFPEMFFKNNQTSAALLGLLLEARKIGLRLARGSKSFQDVKIGTEAEFKLLHDEDFYMMLKSDTDGNYSTQFDTSTGSTIIFRPPKAGIYPLQLFCGKTTTNLVASASFFVICHEDSSFSGNIKQYPKPAYGSWGGIGPKMEEFGITPLSDSSKCGYHRESNIRKILINMTYK